ncbi:hypothetical protein SLEP1_g43567 [Rubroshorea leprosula]|uniref:PGG domain-containing protein n=1 Tax=Rubroshorea leprosula TaxID=152421 RepID=A0AAV5LDH7_9ROSI|nr:hypothetical protein SLEP1_g43567 [Rubroshorea leprosula]
MHQKRQSRSKPETSVEGAGGGKENEMTEDSRYVELKKSICKGDWNAVKQFFAFDKHRLDTEIVSDRGYTALHVAINAGQDNIAEELVKMMSETELEIKSVSSNNRTVLSQAALTGRTHVAKCLVQKNNKLLTIENKYGNIPVTTACSTGHKEMTYYLYSVTPPEVFLPENNTTHGLVLIGWAIDNKMLDICLDLLQRNPKLAVATGPNPKLAVATRPNPKLAIAKKHEIRENSPIYKLSRQPSAFFSGCRLRFWQIWIYHCLKVKLPMISSTEVRIPVAHDPDLKEKDIKIQVSFFAASTSVLMFLGILTSRSAQEDFLESLPRKLIIGLSTLFISIAAMMVSFSAALLITLQDQWWAIIPIIMMASIPVTLFVWLQFPLLVEIFVSTYAPRIFNRKMKPWL